MSVSISESRLLAWGRSGGSRRTFFERLFGHSARSISASKVGIHSLWNGRKLGPSIGGCNTHLAHKSYAHG